MAKRNENNRKIKLFLFHLRTWTVARGRISGRMVWREGSIADAATLVDSISNIQALHIAYIQRHEPNVKSTERTRGSMVE